MIKKISLNFVIFFVFCVMPYYFLSIFQSDVDKIQFFQKQLLSAIFIGGVFLVYLNHKFKKQALGKKWIWLIFEIIGILGILYSGFVLYLIFSLRHLLS